MFNKICLNTRKINTRIKEKSQFIVIPSIETKNRFGIFAITVNSANESLR